MQKISLEQASESARKKFMVGVYNWMLFGLLLSGVAAYFTATNLTMQQFIFGNQFTFLFLIIAELVLVFVLVGKIRTMSVSTASICFVVYAILNGVTLSSVLLVYTTSSIVQIFLITALMFGAMSVYGMFTKTDLTSAGRYLMMGVIGLVIASVINIIFRSSGLDWIISIATVVIFTGLTAYDTQKLMKLSVHADESENFRKVAIIGALELYLDFINIFLGLLRLFGNRR